MLTIKENFLKASRCEKPEWVPVFGVDTNIISPFIWIFDPETNKDWLNTTWIQQDPTIEPMPDIRKPAMTDISQWREVVDWPDLSKIDWEAKVAEFKSDETYDPDKATVCFSTMSGIFLIPMNMMGWVDAMVAMMTERDEFKAFLDAITDFIIEYIGYIGKYFEPDVIYGGDDVAADAGPFISEDVFDDLYFDNFKRIADAIHAQGALAEFHCCGNCQWIIDKEFECGYDITQLPMPNDALRVSMEKYKGRLAMSGGWDRKGPGNINGASEEVVRQSVRDAIDEWGADGGLIFWDGGIIATNDEAQQRMGWVVDEAINYGHEIYR